MIRTGITCGTMPKRIACKPRAAARDDALGRLAVHGLDRLGIKLAERADVACHDREHAGEGAEAHDIDPYERPDQRVDPADGIGEAPRQELDDALRHNVARRQEAEREGEDRRQQRAEEGDGDGLGQRMERNVQSWVPGEGGIIRPMKVPSWTSPAPSRPKENSSRSTAMSARPASRAMMPIVMARCRAEP